MTDDELIQRRKQTVIGVFEDLTAEVARLREELANAHAKGASLRRLYAAEEELAAIKAQKPVDVEVICESCGGSGSNRADNNYGCSTCQCSGFVTKQFYAAPQPAAFLAGGARYKVAHTADGYSIVGLPVEVAGRWVALVAAEDDCHMKAQP